MDEQQVAMLVQALMNRRPAGGDDIEKMAAIQRNVAMTQNPAFRPSAAPAPPSLPPAPEVTSTDVPMPQLNTQQMMPPAAPQQQPYYPSQIPGLPPPEPSVQGNVSPQDRMAIMGMQGDDVRKWMNRPENLIRALMGGL